MSNSESYLDNLPNDVLSMVMGKLTPVDQLSLYSTSQKMQAKMEKVFSQFVRQYKGLEKQRELLGVLVASTMEQYQKLLQEIEKQEKELSVATKKSVQTYMKKNKKAASVFQTKSRKEQNKLEADAQKTVLKEMKLRMRDLKAERARIEAQLKDIQRTDDKLDKIFFGDF